MLRRSFRLLASCATFVALGAPAALAVDAKSTIDASMVTYEKPSGEKFFALSLAAKEGTPRAKTTDIVVLFDTSASQTGVYRDDALATLSALLAELGEKDAALVKLLAVDVNAIEMSTGFVAPQGSEMKSALKKLDARAPLGSTDLPMALSSAAKSFAGANPRSVVYIGDGASRANLLGTEEFSAVIDELVKTRASVSSFAIGPQRDIMALAAVSNHTGGNVYMDGNNISPQQAGTAMAAIATETVVWPTEVTLPNGIQESYPKLLPPLRSDRTSVLIGTLNEGTEQQLQMKGIAGDENVTWTWTVTPADSTDDQAYLQQLVKMARADDGLYLPTLGDQGLAAVRQLVQSGAQDLAELSGRALASGDTKGAKRLAKEALKADPASTTAENVKKATRKPKPAADDGAAARSGEAVIRLVNYQVEGGAPEAGGSLDDFLATQGDGGFLNEIEDQKRLATEVIQAEVELGLSRARELFDTDPNRAVGDLKALLDQVDRAPELQSEVRAQLRDQILSTIQEAQRRQVEKDERDQLRAEREAAALERSRLISEAARREEKVKQIIARFNSLMDEARYREAEEAAYEARTLSDGSPYLFPSRYLSDQVTANAILTARMAGYINDIMAVREARQRGFVDSLFQTEKAHVPFPDEPPITYPDPQVWEELTLRRKKYASIDLAKTGGSEEKIFQALDNSTTLEFIETPLQDVIDYLKDLHSIEIQIDHKALEEVGIGSDTPVTRNLKGITLRSALRLMLKEMDLTYVVRDEVLLITTPEEAESELITKVYPVADLVLPISSGAGANPFSLGGGLGGQGGFGGGLGGGGGGQMGGGFGGGGLGGGGGGLGGGLGGGVLQVQDEVKLGAKPVAVKEDAAEKRPLFEPRTTAKAKPAKVISVTIGAEESAQAAWDKYFRTHSDNPPSTADVRETVRQQMNAKDYAQVQALIQAALKHGQPQPWMYEAIYLALEAQGAPMEDIERALLSSADFSTDAYDLMIVANYMARVGLDARALKTLRDVSQANPSMPEPYVQAIAIADRTGDLEASRWASLGVLRQAWPSNQRELEDKARRMALAVLQRWEKEGQGEQAAKFRAELNEAMVRDIRVEVRWTGDADIDVLVEEPAGTVCSFRNPRTTAGGVMLGDTAARSNEASVDGYAEAYVCSLGFAGKYRVLLRRVWGQPTAGTVTVDVYTNYKTKHQDVHHLEIPVGEKDAVVVFDLENGRRREALAEHQLANAARTQVAISRAVLAQQLNTVTDSEAVRNFELAQRAALRDGRLALPGRRGVGYRPVITTLPEGTNMTATAVISADRRYVRITAVPLFSVIGEVTTFNIGSGVIDMDMDMDMNPPDMDMDMDMDMDPPPFRG